MIIWKQIGLHIEAACDLICRKILMHITVEKGIL